MKEILPTSKIYFHQLGWIADPDHADLTYIYRRDTDDALQIGQIECQMSKLLYDGKSVSSVAKMVGVEPSRVKNLVETMLDSGFLVRIDDILLPDFREKKRPVMRNLPAKYFSWILNEKFNLLLIFIAVSGVTLGLTLPELHLSVSQFIWMDDILFVYLVNIVFQYGLAFIHEFAHFSVTKALGEQARFSIGRRYLYLVFQTESYGIYRHPRKVRYALYLAGILIDAVIIGLAFWFLTAVTVFRIDIGFLFVFVQAQILLQILSIAWQMNAYLETDLYNFLSDFFDEPNLYANTKKLVMSVLRKIKLFEPVWGWRWIKMLIGEEYLKIEADDFRSISVSRKRRMYVYALIMVVGFIFTTMFFLLFVLYREILYLEYAIRQLTQSLITGEIVEILKYSLVIALIASQNLLLLYIFGKDLKYKYQLRRFRKISN